MSEDAPGKKKVLLHEHHNPIAPEELSALVQGVEVHLAFNEKASAAFEKQGVPDVYVVGYNNSRYVGLNIGPMLKDVRWVKEQHPDVRIVAMVYSWHKDGFMKAGAHKHVDYVDFYHGKLDSLADAIRELL